MVWPDRKVMVKQEEFQILISYGTGVAGRDSFASPQRKGKLADMIFLLSNQILRRFPAGDCRKATETDRV
jgi:hypothetical protein